MADEAVIQTPMEEMMHSPRDTRRKSDLDPSPHQRTPGQKASIMPTKTRLALIYQSLISEYAALGSTAMEIAKALSLPKKKVQEVLDDPLFQNEIRKKISSGPIARARIVVQTAVLKAINKNIWLMDNAKNQDVQRKAADSIIALGVGKSGASLFDSKQDIEKLSREQVIEQLRESVAKSENAAGN